MAAALQALSYLSLQELLQLLFTHLTCIELHLLNCGGPISYIHILQLQMSQQADQANPPRYPVKLFK